LYGTGMPHVADSEVRGDARPSGNRLRAEGQLTMATKHEIVSYPVGNGDTTQIKLASGKRILFDFNHCKAAMDEKDPRIDLHKHLKDELKAEKRDYYDVVGFTHSDLDHICGSTEFFELQHAEKYKGNGRTKINELWVPAAMLLEEVTRDQMSDEFALWRKEARYRLLEGKGIKVFSKPQALKDWLHPALKERGEAPTARDYLFVDAGKLVGGLTLSGDGVEFFCHSPFIKHCDNGDIVSNDASLVLNVRLRADGADYDYLHVGDSSWEVLEDIVAITKAHGREDRLRWDLFNLPHHCSYLCLSDVKGEKETEPKPGVKELLLFGKQEAYIVSSSYPIPNSKDMYEQTQPPHVQARNAYESHLNKVKGRKFLVTMEEPNGSKPQPLRFEVSSGGVSWLKAISGAPALLSSQPPRAG
jgi:hypothetical protein